MAALWLAWASALVGAQAQGGTVIDLAGLPDEAPQGIYAASEGRFVIAYADRFVVWKQGIERTVPLRLAPGFAVDAAPFGHAMRAAVDAEGAPHYLVVRAYDAAVTDKDGNVTVKRETSLRWYERTGVYETWAGEPSVERVVIDHAGHPILFSSPAQGGALTIERRGPRGVIESSVTVAPQRYAFDVLVPDDDTLLVLYHDSAAKALVAAKVNLAARTVERGLLDSYESGIENVLLPSASPAGFIALEYFYRNPYYKGLRLIAVEDGAATRVDLDASAERNLGWNLKAALGTDGSLLVSYLDDVLRSRRVTRWYPSLQAVRERAKPEPSGWEAEAQRVFLLVGGGAVLARSGLVSFTPSKSDVPDAASRHDVTYTLADSMSSEALLEGRIGSARLAVTYLHSVLGSELERQTGTAARQAFDLVTGAVGWDQLFFYHDVQLRLEWSRMRGLMEVDGRPELAQTFKGERRLLELALLNAYRFKYGLSYEGFSAPAPAYAYGVASGQKSYTFLASDLRNVTFVDLSLFAGYSLLDYAAKYEVNVARPYVDVKVAYGGSLAYLDRNLEVPAPFANRGFSLCGAGVGVLAVHRATRCSAGAALMARAI